jgi:hypothetical protein
MDTTNGGWVQLMDDECPSPPIMYTFFPPICTSPPPLTWSFDTQGVAPHVEACVKERKEGRKEMWG